MSLHTPPTPARRRRLAPSRHPAPLLPLLLALLSGGAAAQAQPGLTRPWLSSSQTPNSPLHSLPEAGAIAQAPAAPQAPPLQPGAVGGMRQQLKQLSPSQQQQLFRPERDLQVRFGRDRIALLESAERCLKAATNLDQMHNCKRQERQANMELRRRHIQELRALLQPYGITLPVRPGKGGRWGGGPGGPGQPEGPDGFGPPGPGSRGGLF